MSPYSKWGINQSINQLVDQSMNQSIPPQTGALISIHAALLAYYRITWCALRNIIEAKCAV